MPEMTLEQAQDRILTLTEELENLRQTNTELSQNNETLTADNEDLRKLNQKYFNKLIAQDRELETNNGDPEDNTPTCEEFAKDLFTKGGF